VLSSPGAYPLVAFGKGWLCAAAVRPALTVADKLNLEQLRETINGTGLTAVVMSNPRNPTGQAVVGEELDALVKIGVETSTTMILGALGAAAALTDADEFYARRGGRGRC